MLRRWRAAAAQWVIRAFREKAPEAWRITVETSLNVAQHAVDEAFPVVDDYIVDIKDASPDIYRRYTGGDVGRALQNLQWLVDQGSADRILVRLPLIPGYNATDDVARSRQLLSDMGITSFDEFEYIKKEEEGVSC